MAQPNRCDLCGMYETLGGGKNEGLCRRYPPIQLPYAQSAASNMSTFWPTVRNNDWCGEWTAIAAQDEPHKKEPRKPETNRHRDRNSRA